MQITALVRAKRSNKIHIYLDDEYNLSVVEDIITREGLFKGKIITPHDLTCIQNSSLYQELYFKSIGYISRRPRSMKEMKDYLSRKIFDLGLEKKIIDDIIEKLKERKYLNDREFVIWWIQNRVNNSKKSKFEIEIELRQKGVPGDLAKEILAEKYTEDDEVEKISVLIVKQLKKYTYTKLDQKKQIQKLQQYLLGKGFKWHLIKSVISKI